MKERSIILIRVSTTNNQDENLQLPECEKFNEERGWDLINVFNKKESAFKNDEGVWKEELAWAIMNNIKHIIVWNMDRFSRLPEDVVLRQVKILSTVHGIKIHAVHGDHWSQIVESIGNMKDLGFMGEALSEFLEKMLSGLEYRRAHRESLVKSERVKLAVRKQEGEPTKSYRGNKWGRKQLPNQVREKIISLGNQGLSVRKISSHPEVFYYDSNRNKKSVSRASVHKILKNSPK